MKSSFTSCICRAQEMVNMKQENSPIEEVEKLVAVSNKSMATLTVDHTVPHAAQKAREVAKAHGTKVRINELVGLYHSLCSDLTELVGRIGTLSDAAEIHSAEATLHELESQKEWLRNMIIDLELVKQVEVASRVNLLKEASRVGRTTATALRLRFNAVKGCKNFLQLADKTLQKVAEQIKVTEQHSNTSKGRNAKFFARFKSCVAPNTTNSVDSDSILSDLQVASQLVLQAYFSLPPRVSLRHEADQLRSIDLPWIDHESLNEKWRSATAKKWRGAFQQAGGPKFKIMNAAGPIAHVRAQIKLGLDTLQGFKEQLKYALNAHSTAALAAETEILTLRDELFESHECAKTASPTTELPYCCNSQWAYHHSANTPSTPLLAATGAATGSHTD